MTQGDTSTSGTRGVGPTPAVDEIWSELDLVGILVDRELQRLLDAGELATRKSQERPVVSEACVELHVGDVAWRLGKNGAIQRDKLTADGFLRLKPGEIVSVVTDERVELPDDGYGRIYPKGKITTVGLSMASTTIDPGFRGHLNLTLHNDTAVHIKIEVGDSIAKFDVTKLHQPVQHRYSGSHGSAIDSLPFSNQLFDLNRESISQGSRSLGIYQALLLMAVATIFVLSIALTWDQTNEFRMRFESDFQWAIFATIALSVSGLFRRSFTRAWRRFRAQG
jgi:deoxycytidine triphosphate deaminase